MDEFNGYGEPEVTATPDPVSQAQERVTEAAQTLNEGREAAKVLRDEVASFMEQYTAAWNLGTALGLADGHDSPAQLAAMIRTALPGTGRKKRAKSA